MQASGVGNHIISVAVVDDDERLWRSFRRLLRTARFQPTTYPPVETLRQNPKRSRLDCQDFDVNPPMKHTRESHIWGHESVCRPPTPRRLGRTKPLLALIAAATVLSLGGCKKATVASLPPPIVQVVETTATNVPLSAEFIGQLDSPQNVEVRARVEAFVEKMLFTEGTEVKEGDPLFKLDDRSFKQRLAAANADIGQAKAAFFPKVTLTGLYGYQTVALSDLFSASARLWQFGPSVSVPIFTGGALRGNLKLTQARFDEAVAQYQKIVQNSFREVSDSLIAYQRTREFRARQEERTQANRSAADLANVRYEGGVTSYLEVLYNEQELFTAELNLAQARLNELLSVVSLYRSLGGGWQNGNTMAQK